MWLECDRGEVGGRRINRQVKLVELKVEDSIMPGLTDGRMLRCLSNAEDEESKNGHEGSCAIIDTCVRSCMRCPVRQLSTPSRRGGCSMPSPCHSMQLRSWATGGDHGCAIGALKASIVAASSGAARAEGCVVSACYSEPRDHTRLVAYPTSPKHIASLIVGSQNLRPLSSWHLQIGPPKMQDARQGLY